MKLNIREAVASDYESLCALFDEGDALHREKLPWIFQKPRAAVRERDYVLDLIADEAVGFFVAQVKDRLVGLICAVIRESPGIPIFVRRRYAVVDNVVVKREFQRRGIGRALVIIGLPLVGLSGGGADGGSFLMICSYCYAGACVAGRISRGCKR